MAPSVQVERRIVRLLPSGEPLPWRSLRSGRARRRSQCNLDRGSAATHNSHAAAQRANISLIDRRYKGSRRVPYPAIENCN